MNNLNDASNKLELGIDTIPISTFHSKSMANPASIIHEYTLEKKKLGSKLN